MILGAGVTTIEEQRKADEAAAAQERHRIESTVVEIDGTVKVEGKVSSPEADHTVEAEVVEEKKSDPEDLHAALDKFEGKLPKDEHELRAAKELYDEMSEDYKRFIREKVSSLPIVRYRRRAPFTDDEKKIIAAGLMSRTPHYKIAQTLRCSYAKIDKAILEDEFLTELAREAVLREREEVEEGIDDCVRARNPAVLMWKAAKIMPEKYGEQVNLDNEDDTRLVIGAIPDDEIAEADKIVEDMAGMVPVVPTPALIEANEIQAEMQAAGAGVSYVPLSETPATPAVNPPPGDPRFRPLVSAGVQSIVDEKGEIVSAGMRPQDIPDEVAGPDNYTVFNDDVGEFGGDDSWMS